MYGVDECDKGTLRSDRQAEDLEKVISILSSLKLTLDSQSVRGHFRLGKYADNQTRPRPIMVKLIRSADAYCPA